MAKKSKLTLILELQNKLFNNKLMKAKRKLDKVTDKMGGKLNKFKMGFMKNFNDMRAEVPLLGRAFKLLGNPYVMITAGLLSVSVLYGKAIHQAKLFNHEFLQIQNLNLDKTQKSLDQYKKNIREAAFDTGQNLQQTATAFYDLQSATGLYGKQADTVFRKIAKYSTATGAELNDSINMTTKAMKAFGLTEKDIDKYLESNAKTVQTGIVNFKELARVQTEYAGAAAGAGQSVDTANKLFAVFTSITKDARIGATMTKTAFLGLTQESTIKGLKKIGIQLYDANGKMRDLGSILTDVKDKFKTMNSQQIDEIINKIGGPEGLRNMFIKLKTNAADFEKTMAAFDSSKYNLDKAFHNAKNDATVLSGVIRNKINVILARIGETALPTINKILRGIDVVLTWIWKHFDQIAEVVKSVGIAIGIVGGVMLVSSVAAMGLSGALGMVTAGLVAIRVAIFNIPIVGWILLAVSAIVYLVRKTDGWRKQWENLKAFFKDTMAIISTTISIKWHDTIDGMLDKIDKLKIGFYKLKNILGIGNKAENQKAINDIGKQMTQRFMDQGIRKQRLIDLKQNRHKAQWLLHWKKKKATGQDAGSDNPLLQTDTSGSANGGNNNTNGGGGNNGNQLTKVTGKASAPRSITINIDALNKGDINVNKEHINEMSPKDLENFFTDMLMRVVRGAELSAG